MNLLMISNNVNSVPWQNSSGSNKADHLVTVHWRDVCGKESTPATTTVAPDTEEDPVHDGGEEDLTYGCGGFDIGPAAAHAIFLDLPQPELAIPHAAHTLKPNGGICSYSPCVEQSQRTVQAMKIYGFHSINTIEVRLRGTANFTNLIISHCDPTSHVDYGNFRTLCG